MGKRTPAIPASWLGPMDDVVFDGVGGPSRDHADDVVDLCSPTDASSPQLPSEEKDTAQVGDLDAKSAKRQASAALAQLEQGTTKNTAPTPLDISDTESQLQTEVSSISNSA